MPHNRFTKRDEFLHALRQHPVVMGVLNVTPDSFSDGGQFNDTHKAIARAQQMHSQGAAIIDIGAESSRPGHTPISAQEELARLQGILPQICQTLPVAVSIDTSKSEVARKCAAHGAAVINDIWGLQGDADMAQAIVDTECAVVVMHNRAEADESIDIMDDIKQFFARSVDIAQQSGIREERIILDPGMGFGKTIRQNYQILNRMGELRTHGYPLLLGLSRKRMIAHALGDPEADRTIATLAANIHGLQQGASVLRVHDVAQHVDAVKVYRMAKGIS